MSYKHSAVLRGILLLWIVLLLAGCRVEEAVPPIRLAELFPLADAQTETVGMDAALPETAACLTKGWWGQPQSNRLGSFVWSLGKSAMIEALILRPRPLTLRLYGWPLTYDGAPLQRVDVRLNGTPVGGFTMKNGWKARDYAVELPAKHQLEGRNEIELIYSRSGWPAGRGPDGPKRRRPLSAAWSRIVFDGIRPPEPATAETDGDEMALVLPFGSAVDYYFYLPQGGRLRASALQTWETKETPAREGSSLRITTRLAGPVEGPAVELKPGDTLDLLIPPSPEGPVQISLHPRTASSSGGLRLVEPRIHPAGEPSAPTPRGSAERPRRRPNVLVYLVDTLRADHLGAYGYDRPTSPRIDAFAEGATLFTTTMAQTSWTRAATASLFTGLYPQVHGTNGRDDTLAGSVPVLPEIFRDLGYETIGLFANTNVSIKFGFERGFEDYQHLGEDLNSREVHKQSDRVNEEVFRRLRERSTDRPFFLYVHTADPHGPYTPASPYRSRFAPRVEDPELGSLKMLGRLSSGAAQATSEQLANLIGLYDGEIAYNDTYFGELLAELDRLGLAESTVVVFLSDHGEEFLDHGGWEHGKTLFSEQLRVPLIIKLTEGIGSGRRVSAVARQIDILPTLLDFLGETPPPEVQGRSLMPFIEDDAEADVVANGFAAEPHYAYLALSGHELETVSFAGKKLIDVIVNPAPRDNFGQLPMELYDLAEDPTEKFNLIGTKPVWKGFLVSLLAYRRSFWSTTADVEQIDLDEATRHNLEALGYVN